VPLVAFALFRRARRSTGADPGRGGSRRAQSIVPFAPQFWNPFLSGEGSLEKVQRKLAAIVAADVVGYSRLMGLDEAATLARLKLLRREIVHPAVARHGGTVVKTTGDGWLLEFQSAVEAVEFAVALHREIAAQDDDRRLQLRIGINLGDIIVEEDGDIYGDGVNVAARIEALADPGGIFISRSVRDQIRDKLPYTLEDRGEHEVKNIARPVRVFSIATRSTMIRPAAPEHQHRITTPTPSIAVLPFANLSRDPDLDALVDGITEDVITALSKIRAIRVVARNSTFTYKGKAVDIRSAGRDLGVGYAVEGSVQKAGGKIRLTAQLIDVNTGHHLWAEKTDREIGDVFELQDDFSRQVAASVQTQVLIHNALRVDTATPTSSEPDTVIGYWWGKLYELSDEVLVGAENAARDILSRHSIHPAASRLLAIAIVHRMYFDFIPYDRTIAAEALDHARRAAAAPDADEYSYWVLGGTYLFNREHEKALRAFDRALEINPNCSLAYGSKGTVLAWAGQADEAIAQNSIALKANSDDPSNFFRFFGIALSSYVARRYEDAKKAANQSIRIRAWWWLPHAILAAAHAQLGEDDEARDAIAEAVSALPSVSLASLEALPFRHSQDREHLASGLRKAGLQ
jgi:adenylate cyclase